MHPFRSALLLAAVLTACAAAPRALEQSSLDSTTKAHARQCFSAEAWPEADQLFRNDPYWLGGDGASSALLSENRRLWMFGDSWISTDGKGNRRQAHMVSNSLAIQTGSDPSTSTMKFYWGRKKDGSPDAFFPDRAAERLWLGNAVRVGDRLILFFNRVGSSDSGLGFQSMGWAAVMVLNPDAQPSDWQLESIDTPENPMNVLLGFAAVMQRGDYVYAFGSEDPDKSHPIYAVRWPNASVEAGDLMQPLWWAGKQHAWVSDANKHLAQPLFGSGASELSVHWDKPTQNFVVIQTVGFGAADIMLRSAATLGGEWSESTFLFRPGEYSRPKAMIYSAKAHPHLTGADLALTYATNSFDFAEHLSDPEIYYPHFVRLNRCEAHSRE